MKALLRLIGRPLGRAGIKIGDVGWARGAWHVARGVVCSVRRRVQRAAWGAAWVARGVGVAGFAVARRG